MVSNKTIKDYGFTSIEEYFQYIIDSKINGQPQQVTNLIAELSKQQKKKCLNWMEQFENNSDEIKYVKQALLSSL